MNPNLYRHLYKGYQAVQGLLQGFPVNQNPLEMRIAPLLAEQQTFIWNGLHLLQQKSFDQKQFKYVISVIYRNNEAFDPMYRGWIRASKWTESVLPQTLENKNELAKQLRHEIVSTVPHVQKIYGEEEAKFIIPPLFRYEAKVQRGLSSGMDR
ncbi:hypothetical protein [Pseudoneobacillus sp. C159]